MKPLTNAQLDEAMRHMFTEGFRYGYEMASQGLWILASKDYPRTPEPVEVTVLLPDGTSRTAQSKYINGKWTSKVGEVIAWRPKPQPYERG